jgi:hypothetical protein
MAGMLTEADVKKLMADPSPEARADTAAKVADAFGSGTLSSSNAASPSRSSGSW